MPFVTIGGITLHHRHVKATGNARAIVFINSLGTDFRIWDDVVVALDGEMSLLVYDKRGHGLSDIGDINSIDDHVDDLSGAHRSFRVEEGGAVRPVGRRHDRASALCQAPRDRAGPDPVRHGPQDRHRRELGHPHRGRRSARASRPLPMACSKCGSRRPSTPQRVAELDGYCNMLIRQAVAGYLGTCAAIRDADFTEAARRIAVPTLCVVGDQDGSTPPDLVRRWPL